MLTCPIAAFLYFLIQVYFYVTIMKGVVPVSGMDVTATDTNPSGHGVRIKLLDNGAGNVSIISSTGLYVGLSG